MSNYEYTRRTGDLIIRKSDSPGEVFVWINEGGQNAAIHVAAGDAATVAAELLKAAGQEGVFVAKSAGEVTPEAGGLLACGAVPLVVCVDSESSPSELRDVAASYIALAEYIEGKAQSEAEAEKKLQGRRDALMRAFGYHHDWERAKPMFRKAIGRIIELEDGQANR